MTVTQQSHTHQVEHKCYDISNEFGSWLRTFPFKSIRIEMDVSDLHFSSPGDPQNIT